MRYESKLKPGTKLLGSPIMPYILRNELFASTEGQRYVSHSRLPTFFGHAILRHSEFNVSPSHEA